LVEGEVRIASFWADRNSSDATVGKVSPFFGMTITLTVTQGGDRLDRWLADHLPDLSRSRLQKLIEDGQVQINQHPCTDKKQKVTPGDRLILTLPEPEPLDLQPEAIPLDILYEDGELIILNKPAGLVVHPAPGHATGTLVHGLLYHCSDLAGIGGTYRPGIVHRLDKDTSGAIAIAKTDHAHQHLQAQLKAKTARRDYWAVVHGSPALVTGTIDLPIGRHLSDRKKMAVIPLEKGGRDAVTHWRVLERLGNYSWLEFCLETGRTHQIRVHSSHIGHPILGDPIYSSAKSIGINLTGQALHAYRLTLIHPTTGDVIEAIAPPPSEFDKLITLLRQRSA
jgi:23S rRNA pseudouridine1911/1915/1917 synthase